jgi:hypothetical protein
LIQQASHSLAAPRFQNNVPHREFRRSRGVQEDARAKSFRMPWGLLALFAVGSFPASSSCFSYTGPVHRHRHPVRVRLKLRCSPIIFVQFHFRITCAVVCRTVVNSLRLFGTAEL